ncbi:MAG: TonB-dependent receptor [Acidobacteriia bacterium]|nr:TonB-dependent receptor [Terriglobia bacterium]
MRLLVTFLCLAGAATAATGVSGRVFDPQNKLVAGATVELKPAAPSLAPAETRTDEQGRYEFLAAPGAYDVVIQAPGFFPGTQSVTIPATGTALLDLRFEKLAEQNSSVVITAQSLEPAVDLRNAEVFDRTLFSRDDQAFEQLNAGIDAGQHEGGGKSLEIRRFGFNLDHGGVNGGLKVLVDDVQQNQGTQGHGQGYLGSLKALSPELIQSVTIVNGPFSAEYGDFSGLGVVHIRQRESLPDQFTLRLQGGNFNNGRGFFAYSPDAPNTDAYIAYEGSYTDGPFQNPGRYRRDNVNANYTAALGQDEKLGFRVLAGRNDFYSSGQLPLDLVSAGLLDRFGYIDPTDGGRVRLGTLSAYFSKSLSSGDTFRADGFLSRSLFDLYSNFTYYLESTDLWGRPLMRPKWFLQLWRGQGGRVGISQGLRFWRQLREIPERYCGGQWRRPVQKGPVLAEWYESRSRMIAKQDWA